ncbi:unnamed protein product [Penicillium olsonii]|nr:unnamed protein product [Penicillium olsonii]CAG7922632.1 unnamed protein product [Penicillium olsonii]
MNSQARTATKQPDFHPMSKLGRPCCLAGCSLITCILIALAYFLQLTPSPPTALVVPEHDQKDELAIRPRIELHPEDHIHRAPVTQYLDWRVASAHRRPDGVLKRVCLINDLFPGPTIEARSGDTLIISVTNELPEESIALHWHGLLVTNNMDGAVGVSQDPIAPGMNFVYNLTIPSSQSGTFWYHAHSGVSRADGLYGGLIVHAPASKSTLRGLASNTLSQTPGFSYDKEVLLLIGDWYHRPAQDVLDWYTDPGNFGNEPVPDSLVINGVGRFECQMAVPARPVDCVAQSTNLSFGFDPQLKLRIRVVNTGALAGFDLQFDHHTIDLLQVDSADVQRTKDKDMNSLGTLYPGQRMDFVLIPTEDTKGHSSMTVQLNQECFKYANPALTPNQSFILNSETQSSSTTTTSPVKIRHLNIQEIPSSSTILQDIPPTAQQTHVLYTKIQKMARYSNKPFGYFNQTTWRPQQDPPIPLIYLPRSKWDKNQLAISTGPSPAWIDLHGHSFYILATHRSEYGWGSYNPFVDQIPPHISDSDSGGDGLGQYDLSRAALRDTVQIPSRGYAVLRFRADNPGVWLLHCHVLWHSVTGMAMLIDVQGDPEGLAAHNFDAS